MGTRDPRVDAYIAKSAEFARPILRQIRETVHAGCPEVEETMKWSFPHFMYQGILCSMAAFKAHCAFGFWKGSLIVGDDGRTADQAMGQFGRLTSPDDLPSRKTLIGYIRKAMVLNATGVKSPTRSKPRAPRPPARVPADLARALRGNPRAKQTFEAFSPSHQREYIEWITEARTDATRERRLETAIEWMAEGKNRHWKYARA